MAYYGDLGEEARIEKDLKEGYPILEEVGNMVTLHRSSYQSLISTVAGQQQKIGFLERQLASVEDAAQRRY